MPCNEDHPAAIDVRSQADPPAPPIECPKCHTRMKSIAVDDITVDQCQRCGGLWLDAMGKEQLLTDRKAVKSIDTDPAAMGRRQDDLTAIKNHRQSGGYVVTQLIALRNWARIARFTSSIDGHASPSSRCIVVTVRPTRPQGTMRSK